MNCSPFPQAAPDFTDPLGLLRACHSRIAGHCDVLLRLQVHVATHGVDAEAEAAMARVHRYFSTAAPHHHQDEEVGLFPLLRGRDAATDALMDTLQQEHGQLAVHWVNLEPVLAAPQQAITAGPFLRVIEQFVAGYRAHFGKENDYLLPRAAQLLSPDELQHIGQAMAIRRGVLL